MSSKSLITHLKRIHHFPQKVTEETESDTKKKSRNHALNDHSYINQIPFTESQSTIEISQRSSPEICRPQQDNDFQEHLEEIFQDFLLDLHAKSNLTKDIINEIFHRVKTDIIDKICSFLDIGNEKMESIDKAFENYDSQYKFEKQLQKNGYLTKGDDQVISYKIGNVYKNGLSILDEIKEKVCLMPITAMLTKFFETKNILNDVLNYMQTIEQQHSDNISNVLNGTRWKNIKKNYPESAVVIPFDLYTDDFETGNSLGSNAGTFKMTSYYISFPTFPSHLRSCTDYIFEVLLYPARLKYEDFDYCLERLIEIFRELEEDGLILNINGQNMKVFFVLARIVGDNLALNEILGFSTSFNAFKYCRVCKLNKNDAKNNIVPCSTDLRNYEEYEIDKLKNDYHETGIRRDCIFNTLLNFHCTENIVFDIMHDLYEGIVKHDVALILKAFIDDKSLKHIKLDKINTIKQNFNYGRIEIGNLSLPIQDNHLKNCCLKMSASEAKTFLHFLPLMIGNLIPTDNKYWKLLQNLINISDLVMLSNFNADLIEQLRESIHKYTESFHQTFKTKLKPKHHFLQHYMDCIEYNGPLRYMMTFSYETKNRIVKNYANVCNQRKNLPKTLFYKAAMRFNNLIRKHKDGFAEITTHEKTFPYDLNVFCKLDYFNYLDLDFLNNQPIFKCKKMIHKRTIYEIECFIIDDIFNPKKLMQIIDILYVNEEHYLITKLYTIEKYDEHLMSYKVGEFNGIYNLVMSNEIASLPLNLHKITTGTYFRVKAI